MTDAAASNQEEQRPSTWGAGFNAFALAVIIVMTAGFLEAAVLTVRRELFGQIARASMDVLWQAPIGNLLLVLLPAAGIGLAAKLRPHLIDALVVTTLFGTPAIFSLLTVFAGDRFHWLASAVLALGVSFQLGRWLRKRGESATPWIRRAMPALATLAVVIATVSLSLRAIREHRMLTSLPDARADAPNVLIIILDTVRAASLSLYGNAAPTTPSIERWANSGVVFEHAIAPSSWTLPSHATLFTGRYPTQLTTDWTRPLDGSTPTLAEAFLDNGYVTMGFVANLSYTTRESGLSRGFIHYEDYKITPLQLILSAQLGRLIADRRPRTGKFPRVDRKTGSEVSDAFLAWHRDRPNGRPYFAFLNYFDAHSPYRPPADALARVRSDTGGPPVLDRYHGTIAALDEEIDRVLKTLEEAGELHNTIVVITSDHGEQFGEHNLREHGNSLYRELIEVPLLISAPRRLPGGVRVGEPVTLRDVPATVAALADLRAEPFPGSSLAARWGIGAGRPSPILSAVTQQINAPAHVPNASGSMQSVVSDGWHYIRNGDGSEELYDFTADPLAAHDRAGDPTVSALLDKLRRLASMNPEELASMDAP